MDNDPVQDDLEIQVDVDANKGTSEDNLQTKVSAMEQNQALMTLISDPDVQAVLEAKRLGKPVRINTEEEEPTQEDTPVEEEIKLEDIGLNIEEDDPSKEFVDKLVKGVAQIVESRVNQVTDRLSNLEALASSIQQQEASNQVTAAQKKYPDLARYKQKMLELSRSKGQGLTVEELYILAKHESGKLQVAKPAVFTERPSVQPMRKRPEKREAADMQKANRRARWNSALDKALEGLQLEL